MRVNHSARPKPRKRKQPDPEYSLLANVKSVTSSSYFFSTHGSEPGASTDEALVDLLAAPIALAMPTMFRQRRFYSM